MLNEFYAQQRTEKRQLFMIILSSIRFLARQGLSLHGHYKVVDGNKSGANREQDFNFSASLQTQVKDQLNLSKWLKKSPSKSFQMAEEVI